MERWLRITTTHDSSVFMLNATYLRWNASLPTVQDIPDIMWSLSLELLLPAIYVRAPSRNSLDLLESEGSLVVTNLSDLGR